MKSRKVPISVLVVGYNESHLLKECLESVQFCDEVLYFDLGSTDQSLEIAAGLATKVVPSEWVPIGEYIHAEQYKKAKHKWILLLDPDERISPGLKNLITDQFSEGEPGDEVAALSFSWRYYFGSRQLKGTPWGYKNEKILILHRDRFLLTKDVHAGRQPLGNYQVVSHEHHPLAYGDHYWVSGWKDLINKHKRYLKEEGRARYERGARPKLITIIASSIRKFNYSLFTKKGYLDRGLGFALSLFYAWYEWRALVECRKGERLKSRIKSGMTSN